MTPAILFVRKAKIAHDVLSYEHDPAAESYGREAVDLLRLEPATVFKVRAVKPAYPPLAVAFEGPPKAVVNRTQAAFKQLKANGTVQRLMEPKSPATKEP